MILPDVDIGRKCELYNAIIDRGCRVPEGMSIGKDAEEDRRHGFYVTERGVTLVTPEMLGQQVNYVR
mgnify:FL=1